MRPKLHADGSPGDAWAAGNVDSPDRVIARLAARQRGVVTHDQLVAAGLQRDAIKRRVRSGRLHPVHRGVYLVGHRAMADGARELAALLACGRATVLSHLSAAHLLKLLPYPAHPGPVDVTVVGRQVARRAGIRVHRVRALRRRDMRPIEGIAVTSPARTLFDLAPAVPLDLLERALAEAQVRRLVTQSALGDQLERNRGRRGTRALRRLVDVPGGPAPTRSEAERRVLRLLRASELPLPRVNARVEGYEVDFLWPDHKLVVEVDGYAFHSSRAAFERDRARDAALAAAGYTVLRVTWRQLVDASEAVVARIAQALAMRVRE